LAVVTVSGDDTTSQATMILQTFRTALRRLGRAWSYAAVSLITITVCVGVNAALLSFLFTLAVRPQPGIPRAHEVFQIVGNEDSRRGWSYPSLRVAHLIESSDLQTATIASYEPQFTGMQQRDHVARLVAEAVSRNFFAVLQPPISRGRGLIAADFDSSASSYPVVISSRLWKDAFASEQSIIGTRLSLDGRSGYEIVGITGPDFHGPEGLVQADLWIPSIAPLRGSGRPRVIGRLNAGRSLSNAEAELTTRWAREDTSSAFSRRQTRSMITVSPLRSGLHNEQMWAIRVLLGGALSVTTAVLLLACVNLSGLSLIRVIARRRELAVARAIGAKRRHLLGEVLAEVIVLFVAGGTLGVCLAKYIATVLVDSLGAPFPFVLGFTPDPLTILGTAVICFLATFAAALIPAYRGASMDPASALRADAVASSVSVPLRRTQSGLVIVQIAICTCLLTCASIVYRSMAIQLDPRIGVTDPDQIITASLPARDTDEPPDALLNRLSQDPRIASTAIAQRGPAGGSLLRSVVVRGAAAVAESISVGVNAVSPGYFATVAPLSRGREFTAADLEASAARVAIIDAHLASTLFNGAEAIGRVVQIGSDGHSSVTIIGIARAIRYDLGKGPSDLDAVYLPLTAADLRDRDASIVARSRSAAIVRSTIDSAIRAFAPGRAITRARTVREEIAEQSRPVRSVLSLLAVATGLTLLLSVVGVYGLVAFTASSRRKEIGVRTAFGATRLDIYQLFSNQALRLGVFGVVIGAGLTAVLFRLLPDTWRTSGLSGALSYSVAIMVAVALASSLAAVTRAGSVDPAEALR
jgi:predicted permease